MQVRITKYLTRMSENPSLRLAFGRDPERAMADAGLSARERGVLASGVTSDIYRAAGVDEHAAPKIVQIPALPA
jgi:hypothetical protein